LKIIPHQNYAEKGKIRTKVLLELFSVIKLQILNAGG
jgi:hypothetical protein